MPSIQINRVNFSISTHPISLFFQKDNSKLLFRSTIKNLIKKFSPNEDFKKWVIDEEINDDDYVYYGFTKPEGKWFKIDNIFFTDPKNGFNYFRRKYVRELLIIAFQKQGFLIHPYPVTWDLSLFCKIGVYSDTWETFRRYDLQINIRNELIFNIGSDKTLISVTKQSLNGEHIKLIDTDGFIKSASPEKVGDNFRIIANREIREQIGIPHEVKKLSYSKLYNDLLNFYNSHLLKIDSSNFKVEAGGLKNVEPQDCFNVNMNQNQMVFGNNQTDINPVSGMRDFGPFRKSIKATENKFIFIYENRDDANKLYFHFKNGLKHFPGLWSYVGVPATLADFKLKYSGLDNLKAEFDAFISTYLSENTYTNYFAIVIGPFNRQEFDEEQSTMYYYLKGKLLEKGIPSQFINHKGLREGSFHYYLPNIAVAILAKLGGVPWKLKTKKQHELVIGFNQLKIGENRYIGSAVFFSNEGTLGSVVGYPETDSESALIRHLRASIEKFIASNENHPPERLVIHYYKPYSEKEYRSIEDLIQKELRINIPFAIIEINDSKTQTDICFDPEFRMGMPESGTYVKVGYNEYLLFNNTRYQKNPARAVSEELPIKIKIHFADTGGFSHKDIISQIYEFSRLYWKGLKQRSQPATTIYAKLIADFEAHFNTALPNNQITHQIPWFI